MNKLNIYRLKYCIDFYIIVKIQMLSKNINILKIFKYINLKYLQFENIIIMYY